MLRSLLLPSLLILVVASLYALSTWLLGRHDRVPSCDGESCDTCREGAKPGPEGCTLERAKNPAGDGLVQLDSGAKRH